MPATFCHTRGRHLQLFRVAYAEKARFGEGRGRGGVGIVATFGCARVGDTSSASRSSRNPFFPFLLMRNPESLRNSVRMVSLNLILAMTESCTIVAPRDSHNPSLPLSDHLCQSCPISFMMIESKFLGLGPWECRSHTIVTRARSALCERNLSRVCHRA